MICSSKDFKIYYLFSIRKPYVAMEIFHWGGAVQKIFGGDVGDGIQMFNLLSVREIFFCFVSKFLKIKSGIYKFPLQGDMGRDAR